MARQTLRRALLIALLASLTACASAPLVPAAPPSLLADARFAPAKEPVDAKALFTLSPAMQRYAEDVLRPAMRHGSAEQALVEALYDAGRLKLEYDAASTRTAAQAFEARAGNCLSLVVMTAAFARHFAVPVHFREVYTELAWSRIGGVEMANRHVNLALVREHGTARVTMGPDTAAEGSAALVVDFMPRQQAARQRVRPLSERTITAMYLNNRAGEALADGDPDRAYWWARETIIGVPEFTDGYNTLGVVYTKRGLFAEAETVLRHALALEPENPIPLANLIGVLRARGKQQESAALAARLARLEPHPPFHFLDAGIAALKRGEDAAARDLLQREVNRMAYLPEAHFWLGVAHLRLGERGRAEKHLARAVEHSTTADTRAVFSAKLAWLKAQG